MEDRGEQIAMLLIEQGKRLLEAERVPTEFTGEPAADELLNDLDEHPHAFVLACIADRQVETRKAWLVPHELSQRLKGFSFDLLQSLSPDDFSRAFTQPGRCTGCLAQ